MLKALSIAGLPVSLGQSQGLRFGPGTLWFSSGTAQYWGKGSTF